jgi:hypothetical protein
VNKKEEEKSPEIEDDLMFSYTLTYLPGELKLMILVSSVGKKNKPV